MGVFICQQNMIWHLCLVNPMRFDMRDIDRVIKNRRALTSWPVLKN